MNQEPKAYSYVRFSTPEQAKGNSLERQTAASEKYAREHNLTLDKSLKADQGVSAFRRKNALRGNLANFLKEISDGQVPKGSVLIIENMDRLSRAPIMDSSEIVNQILRAGIDIVTLSDGLRHRAADIELNSYAYMLPVMSLCRAYEESKRKSELLLKTWESKRKAAMKGERLTSTCPGWLIPTEIGFEIIPERAVIVREIFDLTLQGWGAYRIAQKFSSEEVPPFSSGRKREAKGWHSSFIRRLLSERKVLGELELGTSVKGVRVNYGETIKGYYPPVIDEFTWAKANQRVRPSRGRSPSGLVNLFTGLLRDGYTDAPMRFVNKSQKEKHHSPVVFLISDAKRFKDPNAAKNWPYFHFEQFLLKYLRDLDWQAIVAGGKSSAETDLENREALAASMLEKLLTDQGRLVEAIRSGNTPPAILVKELSKLETEIKQTEDSLSSLRGELRQLQNQTIALQQKPDLATPLDTEAKMRLRHEIRRRVQAIYIYTEGFPTPEGIILTPLPSVQIIFSNGTAHLAICGKDNSFSKAQAFAKFQPRGKNGAFVSMEDEDRATAMEKMKSAKTA